MDIKINDTESNIIYTFRKNFIEEYKKNNKVGSTAYTCSKCKKKNTLVTQKQTRAGDEPPTIFVECLECGNKWTES